MSIVAILHSWLGVIPGSFVVDAASVALALFATCTLVLGLQTVLGRAGLILGAAFTLLVANPISAAALPPNFLLEPWGAIGQWLVPGASLTLLRNVSYFPDANITFRLWVLAGWVILGVSLLLLGQGRRKKGATA
jgi:hypothetical protein